jgi:1-acyl-sn-glycerol-3-phosphate acyltransferase
MENIPPTRPAILASNHLSFIDSGAPVIPVAMMGTRKMLPPGAPLPRPTRIEIRIGKPLEFGHLAGEPPAKARRVVARRGDAGDR